MKCESWQRLCRTLLAPALALALAPACAREGPGSDHAEHADEHADHEKGEFRVTLAPEAVANAGIETAAAGPRALEVTVQTPGEVRLNGERILHVRPRFAGVVRALGARLGDLVAPGDTLAGIHSNESLTDYAIVASMRGTVVTRDVAVGAAVATEDVLYTLADFSTVWVDFAIYPDHVGRVRRGARAHVAAGSNHGLQAAATVDYVGPLLEQDTRVSYGRIVLPNPEERWQPGLYVTVSVVVDRAEVPVAVPEEAILRSQFGPAVFRAAGTSFELQPIVPGRTDGVWTEVQSGLEPGATIVVKNPFLLKAELGKSEAAHDH